MMASCHDGWSSRAQAGIHDAANGDDRAGATASSPERIALPADQLLEPLRIGVHF